MLSSPIDEIKNRLDIVEVIQSYIRLAKAGANYRAICPFHSEKKPSFFVSPARQIWHCFGCGKGGDVFGFVKEIEGLEFGDALRILAQKAGVELKRQDPKLKTERQRLYDISALACRFFEAQLEKSSAGKEAKKYLLDRGISEESVKKWRLGYAPDNWQGLSDFLVGRGFKREEIERAGLALKSEKGGSHYDRFRARIMFPVFDLSSQVVGFGARIFKKSKRPDGQEEAKYINTPSTLLYDKSRILYGLNKSSIDIRKKDACILVEGYTDVILAHQAGFDNVVAASGTALTSFQLKILRRYSENLFTAFDMDIAGDSATKRGVDLAQTAGFNIKIITMPQDLDPADVISKEPAQWENLIKGAKSIHDFYFDSTLAKFDKNTLEGKKSISKILLPIIKRIPNKIEQTLWLQNLAGVLGVQEQDVLEELKKVKAEPATTEFQTEAPNTVVPPQKTRKDLLEERLSVLTIKSPKAFDLLTQEDFQVLSQQICRCLNFFKQNNTGAKAALSPELNSLVDLVSLRAEVEDFGGEKEIEKEFKHCLKEIKTLVIKAKLDKIAKEIKKTEGEKNLEKVQELIKEFNLCSKELGNSEAPIGMEAKPKLNFKTV